MNKLNTFINKSWYWIIIVLGIVVFANSLFNPFVLDDSAQVTNNPAVHSISNIPRLFLGSTFAGGANLAGVYYKPLMTSSYALLYSTFGATPFVFHLFQILLHIANAILVFLILKKMLQRAEILDSRFSAKGGPAYGGRGNMNAYSLDKLGNDNRIGNNLPPLFLALIFLVHPLNNESVIYVSGLQEPLFFFFGALAFLSIVKVQLSKVQYVLFGAFMALSLLSKETGLMFLAVSVAYRFIWHRKDYLKLLFTSTLIFLVYFGVRFAAVGTPVTHDRVFPITRLTLMQRLMTAPGSILYYIRNFFFPNDFAVAQHWVVTSLDGRYFWTPLVIVVGVGLGVLVFGWRLWKSCFCVIPAKAGIHKNKGWIPDQVGDDKRGRAMGDNNYFKAFVFFAFWFAIGIMLHLNILPLDFTVADRWFYFPVVGLLGMLGAFFSVIPAKAGIQSNVSGSPIRLGMTGIRFRNFQGLTLSRVIGVIGVGIIVALSARSMVRNFDWRSGLALASRDVKYSRDSFPLENNLGFELINAGKYKEAEVHVKKSVELGPWWWLNWNNLGVIYRHNGQYDRAQEAFGKAVANTNTFYMPYENLAELLLNEKSPKSAVDFIVETSKKLQLSGRLWFLLSLSLSQTDDQKAALQAAQKAVELAPNDPQSQALYQGLSQGKKIQLQKTAY